MNMISLPVKRRMILGLNKGDMWVFYPVIIWLVVSLTTFFIYLGTDNTVILLVFFAVVLTIIPVFIFGYKKSNKYRGDNAYYTEEVTFHVEDGALFAGEIKILNISFNKKEHSFNVNDVEVKKSQVKGIPISVPKASFIGIIEEPYSNEFMKFIKGRGVRYKTIS